MKVIWKQNLGKPECPYAVRWVFQCKWFSVRLHHWNFGDDPRAMHDHAWWFWVFVLWGSYTDVTATGRQPMPQFTLKFRPALHRHTVETKGAWTIILTGPETRDWGFYKLLSTGHYRWVKARRWFFNHGHHPCDN